MLASTVKYTVSSAQPAGSRGITLTIRVFADTIGTGYPCAGCNGILDGGEVNLLPLPPVQITVRDVTTGQEIERRWARHLAGTGANYTQFILPLRDGYVVEITELPLEFQLCPNSPPVRQLAASAFSSGSAIISFYLWHGCPLLAISPTPTMSGNSPTTATPTSAPTISPSRVPSHTPTATVTETLTPATTLTPLPTATPCSAGIAGQVWDDVNGNALQDPGEPALAHAILTLWEGDSALRNVVTDVDGHYAFLDLAPGVFRLVETDPPDYQSTTDGTVVIQAVCGITTQNFGDQATTACPRGVSGVVWHDLDGDGLLEIHEPPLPETTLTLHDSTHEVVSTLVTGEDGVYLIEGLGADVYALIEHNPPGFPISTTLDNWIVDLVQCRVLTINFGDQSAAGTPASTVSE